MKSAIRRTKMDDVDDESKVNDKKHKGRCGNVQFKKTAKVVLIPKREEYINAGMAPDLWWNGPEYHAFRRQTAEELAKCMSDWRVSGRQAMDMLYQGNCRKALHDIKRDLIFIVPRLEESKVPKSSISICSSYEAQGHYINIQLSCLISMQDQGIQSNEDWTCLHLRSTSALLFEEVLGTENKKCHPILDTGKKLKAALSVNLSSITTNNVESESEIEGSEFCSSRRRDQEINRVCQIDVPRYEESTKKDDLPHTWEEATSKEWEKVPLVILSDVHPFRIVYANDKWLSCFEYTSTEVIGKTLSILHGRLTSRHKSKKFNEYLQHMYENRKMKLQKDKDKSFWLSRSQSTTPRPSRQFVKCDLMNYTKSRKLIDNSMLTSYLDKNVDPNLFISRANIRRMDF